MTSVVMFEEEQQAIQRICDSLLRDSDADAILVLNKDAQEIACAFGGEDRLSLESLIPAVGAWSLAERDS